LRHWADQRIAAARLPESTAIELKLTDEAAIAIVQQSQTSWRQAATLLHIWVAQIANQAYDWTV
jgi:hypothetical protein